MRKITDLKPNECIHIRTEKEAKKIKKLTGLELLKKGKYVVTSKGKFWWSSDIPPEKEILPASDFIKKSNTKKRLEKLEKTVEEGFKEIFKAIGVENQKEFDAKWNYLHEKPFVLPEKWCIVVNNENKEMLSNWTGKKLALNNIVTYFKSVFYKGLLEDVKGYTEITTEHFIEQVLNRKVNNFQFNNWYKSDKQKALFYIDKLWGGGYYAGYGFDHEGNWFDYDSYVCRKETKLTPATTEEVSTALIAEAERRGFTKDNVIINNSALGFCFNEVYKKGKKIWWHDNYLNIGENGLAIFQNGKWAEIIQQETINKVINVFNEFNKRASLNLQESADLINLSNELQLTYNEMVKPQQKEPNPIPKQSELKPVAGKK